MAFRKCGRAAILVVEGHIYAACSYIGEVTDESVIHLGFIPSIYTTHIYTLEKRKKENIKHAGPFFVSFSHSTGFHYLITLASARN